MEETIRRRVLLGLLLAAVAVGTALRLWNLRAQVMGGDELHAVRTALTQPLSAIFFTYRVADNCIPLTAFDRLLLDRGVPLTEMLVRLPVLVSGLALLVLAPWWAWRRLGPETAVIAAWLLAVSPALVFYSRIARPYAPAALLGGAAVAAFDGWWRRRTWGFAAAYVACAALAVWFHLVAAPLVLAPLLAGALGTAMRRGRGAAGLALVGAATATAFLGLLVPARHTLLPLIASKQGDLELSAGEIVEVSAWLAGMRAPWLAVPFWVAVAAGLLRVGRHERWLAALVTVAAGAQVVGILVLAPFGHQVPMILARYLVPALPLALLAAAAAVGRPWPARWQAARPLVAATAIAGLIAAGPFTDPALARSSFAHDNELLRFTASPSQLPPEGLPRVYRWLAHAPPGAILEMPWHPVWRFGHALGVYQRAHQRQVVVTVSGPPFAGATRTSRSGFAGRRLAFRNMSAAHPAEMLRSRARWLIVHRALAREERRIGSLAAGGPTADYYRRAAQAQWRRASAAWGPPDYQDHWTWMWDLDRIRRNGRSPAVSPPVAPRR